MVSSMDKLRHCSMRCFTSSLLMYFFDSTLQIIFLIGQTFYIDQNAAGHKITKVRAQPFVVLAWMTMHASWKVRNAINASPKAKKLILISFVYGKAYCLHL